MHNSTQLNKAKRLNTINTASLLSITTLGSLPESNHNHTACPHCLMQKQKWWMNERMLHSKLVNVLSL